MTNQKKYVAYVSTYTMGDNHGITIYDVDVENGRFTLKDRVEITNSSYLTISHNRKWLYSITDFGVESYEILKDGHLKPINMAGINGMRGCYLSTDYEDRFLFVAGWHDGKITALRLKEDGSVGEITENAFVADFIGDSNIIDGIMIRDELVSILGQKFPCVDKGFGTNKPVDVVIRPEDVDLVKPEEGTLTGTVTHLIFKGVHYEMEVTANGFEWLVHSTDMFPVGTEVGIRVDPFDIQIMNKPASEDEEAVSIDE